MNKRTMTNMVGRLVAVAMMFALGCQTGYGNVPGDSNPSPTDAAAPMEVATPPDSGPSCTAPRMMCGGACVDTMTDGAHCGGCNNACGVGNVCRGGACVSATPPSDVGMMPRPDVATPPPVDSGPLPVCNPGDRRLCACGAAGNVGIQDCASDRMGFTICACPASDGGMTVVDSGPAFACGLGDTRACACPGGVSGSQMCRDDRAGFTTCACPVVPDAGPMRLCVPGSIQACACTGLGLVGSQTCASNGLSFGGCTCPVLPVDAGAPDVGTPDSGSPDVGSPDAGMPTDLGPACSTGQTLCDGTCRNLMTDVANCGACRTRCNAGPNARALCAAGGCEVVCNTGFADCDGNPVNGCEANTNTNDTRCGGCDIRCNDQQICRSGECVARCDATQTACAGICRNTLTDTNNCGACGRVCPGGQLCVSGACTSTCPAGRRLCGTECVDLDASALHCGGCGNVCSFSNARALCVTGTCALGACFFGMGNCDGNSANGCETNIDASVAHCGACGNRCVTRPNSSPMCDWGFCRHVCNVGFADCNGNPTDGCEVNLRTSASNCGACGTSCGTGQSCVTGVCVSVCPAGQTSCSGVCRNLASDMSNCGACGVACFTGFTNATTSCMSSGCNVACNPGFGDCNGNLSFDGCETPLGSNNANCGMCGRVCPSGTTCTAGACAPIVTGCTPGLTNCSGSCRALATDALNCGTCGNVCTARPNSNPVCVGGGCGVACYSSYGNCDGNPVNGCETALTTSSNCGGCGVICTGMMTCNSGSCSVPVSMAPRFIRGRLNNAADSRFAGAFICTWDLNADPSSAMFCSVAGGELYQTITGVYWPGNHVRLGVALDNPYTTAASRVRWIVNDIANVGRTARQLGFSVLQIEQFGVATQDVLDVAQSCLDVCHPLYPGWRESKVTVAVRPGASICPAACGDN